MFVGSDHGIYRINETTEQSPERVLETNRVLRLQTFLDGNLIAAATESGLFASTDGEHWLDLGVPAGKVFAVECDADNRRLVAGSSPARIFEASLPSGSPHNLQWDEMEGFRDRPIADEWGLARHGGIAHVRDIAIDPAKPSRLIAALEVGGVHFSHDGGDTWTYRRGSVDDDIHELHVVGADTYVAATGFGLYVTETGGDDWVRLDGTVEQRYFRSAFAIDGTIYAGGALANSSTWDDPEATPALFTAENGTVEQMEYPHPTETVTGMTAVDGELIVATHRGHVFRRDESVWIPLGQVPASDDPTGRYTPIVG